MGKFISKQGIQNFGEAFLSTIDRERKLRQDQDQFNQAQAFRERQLDFLNVYRNSLTEQAKAQEERLQAQFEFNKEQANKPAPPKPITETSLEPLFGGKVEVKRETDPTTGESRIIDYGSHYKPSKTETTGGGENISKPKKHQDIADKVKGLETAENKFRTETDEGKRKEAFDNVRGFSEGLISDIGLELERDILWDDWKAKVPFNETIKNINKFRKSQGKETLNEQEFDALRRYRNARFPENYSPKESKFLGIF